MENSYYLTMMEHSYKMASHEISRQATDCVRRSLRAAEISQEDVATHLHVNRQTVGLWLNSGNVKLERFIELAFEAGRNPCEVLKQAMVLATGEEQEL